MTDQINAKLLAAALDRLSLRPDFNRFLAAKTDAEALQGNLSVDLILAASLLQAELGLPTDKLADLIGALLDELDRRSFDTLPWRLSMAGEEAASYAARRLPDDITEDECDAYLAVAALIGRARYAASRDLQQQN